MKNVASRGKDGPINSYQPATLLLLLLPWQTSGETMLKDTSNGISKL
jgi:hypothetical protein